MPPALPYPAFAAAQDTTAIAGTVKDASGAVLPGVTVEAASPALIEKVRSVITDERGEYKIVDLRPGSYTVTFALHRLRRDATRRHRARRPGSRPRSTPICGSASVEETITVSGASPVVDTQSVAARRVVTKDVIDALPTGKNWNGIGQLTVGVVSNQVDVGGSSGEQQNQVSIHGGSYTDNIRTLDGMMLSNFACAYSCTGLSANDSSTQELSFDIGALSAEVAGGGIRINIVPRDGGNQFSGSAFGSIATKELQSSNLTQGLRDKGITSVDSINKLWDSSVGMGGPLKVDKLWLFASVKYWGTQLLPVERLLRQGSIRPTLRSGPEPPGNRRSVEHQLRRAPDHPAVAAQSPVGLLQLRAAGHAALADDVAAAARNGKPAADLSESLRDGGLSRHHQQQDIVRSRLRQHDGRLDHRAGAGTAARSGLRHPGAGDRRVRQGVLHQLLP